MFGKAKLVIKKILLILLYLIVATFVGTIVYTIYNNFLFYVGSMSAPLQAVQDLLEQTYSAVEDIAEDSANRLAPATVFIDDTIFD
jgi:hypothetical protein